MNYQGCSFNFCLTQKPNTKCFIFLIFSFTAKLQKAVVENKQKAAQNGAKMKEDMKAKQTRYMEEELQKLKEKGETGVMAHFTAMKTFFFFFFFFFLDLFFCYPFLIITSFFPLFPTVPSLGQKQKLLPNKTKKEKILLRSMVELLAILPPKSLK